MEFFRNPIVTRGRLVVTTKGKMCRKAFPPVATVGGVTGIMMLRWGDCARPGRSCVGFGSVDSAKVERCVSSSNTVIRDAPETCSPPDSPGRKRCLASWSDVRVRFVWVRRHTLGNFGSSTFRSSCRIRHRKPARHVGLRLPVKRKRFFRRMEKNQDITEIPSNLASADDLEVHHRRTINK